MIDPPFGELLIAHLPTDSLGHEEDAFEIDINSPCPNRSRLTSNARRRMLTVSGIVDEDIDSAESLCNRLHACRDRIERANIERNGDSGASGCGG